MRTDVISSRSFLFAAMFAALGLLFLATTPAQAEFGIANFSGSVTAGPAPGPGEPAPPETQAGAHPYAASTTIGFNQHSTPSGPVPDEDVKTIEVDLPPGFLGDPTALPRCARSEFAGTELRNPLVPDCPVATQVGTVRVQATSGIDFQVPVFNLKAPAGKPAQFGFQIFTFQVFADATVRPGDHGVTVVFRNVNQTLGLRESKFTLWGNPASSIHDEQRDQTCIFEIFCEGGGFSAGVAEDAFLTNPMDCSAGPLTTSVRANSWQHPEVWKEASFDTDFTQEPPLPMAVTGCDLLKMPIEMSAAPTTGSADSPSGLAVTLEVPQDQSPTGLATAELKRAEVTLPEGVTVNAASAGGLGACSESQIGLDDTDPADCPPNSRIGSVTIESPLLDETMDGSVYLAEQGNNPLHSLLGLYLVAEAQGVTIKLAGKVSPDPQTGRLTTTFDDNPQLPFSRLDLRFKGGGRAPLATPPSCGTYQAEGRISPWSAVEPDNPTAAETVSPVATFEVGSGPGGGPCPSGTFTAGLSAGVTNPLAGMASPFVLSAFRPDGTQRMGALEVSLPKGVLASLRGIPYCPEGSLAGVSSAEGSGASELATPSCPAASRLGSVSVGAGVGSNPFYVSTGSAYLAGPYKGAPLSIAFVTPAIAGPFDLGTVLVRAALRIDPVTAQATAVSDPLPTILHGIPLNLRDVRVNLDRRDFTLNPTSCAEQAVTGSAISTAGATAPLSDRFQVAGCGDLGFKPKLSLSLSGPTRRSAHPSLKAVLKMPKGNANIGKAVVTLPETEFLENAHIRTICTRVQYAADQCPKGSIYGYAKAWTPLLDEPLQGPVYLRSSNHKLPDLVADLNGQIEIDLAGRIDSPKGRLRNTFWAVPDAPVSKFVLTMQGGKKGLLVNNTELCRKKPRAKAEFTGQNGKVQTLNPLVKTSCGKR